MNEDIYQLTLRQNPYAMCCWCVPYPGSLIINAELTLYCSPQPQTPTITPTTPFISLPPTLSPTYLSTCESFNYSWNCLHGTDGYPSNDSCSQYDGYGMIDIGEGNWNFDYDFHVVNEQIVLQGD
eukprot:168201_1